MVAVSGRNWGDALVDHASLVFKVDKKPAFSIALPDVSQVHPIPYTTGLRAAAQALDARLRAPGVRGLGFGCRQERMYPIPYTPLLRLDAVAPYSPLACSHCPSILQ